MNTQFSVNPASIKSRNWQFWLVCIACAAGLVLSILSWLEVCVEHCSANQDYLLLGMPFPIVGIPFFSLLLILHFTSSRFKFLSQWIGWMIASALGAEIMFVAVQRYQIGHWCPVCLGIAAAIAFAALILSFDFFSELKTSIQLHNRGALMQLLKKSISTLTFLIAGFLLAFVGVSNPNSAEAVTATMKERLAFVQKDSPVEVYYITDWFCPSCKKVEPVIEKLLPEIKTQATFFFIDYPIHQKSMNFTPFNLALLIDNKKQYIKGRRLLAEIAGKTESPKEEDVERAMKKKNIAFKELSFVDVKNGMDFFEKIVSEYKLNSTPTLILTNNRTHEVIKLEGRTEITEEKVTEALKKIAEGEKEK